MKLILPIGLFLALLIGAASALFGGLAAIALAMLCFPLVFILRDYRVGVVLMIMLMPFANLSFAGHLATVSSPQLLVCFTAGCFVLERLLSRRPLLLPPAPLWWRYLLPIGLALLVGLTHLGEVTPLMVQVLGDEYSGPFKYLLALGFKPMLIVLASVLIANAVRDSERPQLFLVPVVVSTVLFSALLLGYILWSGLGISAISGSRARNFLSPLGMHANEFGAMFGMGVGIMLFMVPAVKSGFYRLLLCAALVISLVALLLTFSRGGYVLAFTAVVYFLLSQRRAALAFGALVFLVLVLLLAPKEVYERAGSGIGEVGGGGSVATASNDDQLTAGRVWLWSRSFPNFYRNPVTGSGLSSQAWSDAVKSGVIKTAQTHNFYLSILYDTGLVGMAVVLSFFVFVYRAFKSVARDAATPPVIAAAMHGSAAVLIGYGLMGFTNSTFWPRIEHIYLWMMFGICMAFLKAPVTKAQARRARGQRAALTHS
ncbi:MAG: O-antigen ligase family protein [Pseudomonadota bacterium]